MWFLGLILGQSVSKTNNLDFFNENGIIFSNWSYLHDSWPLVQSQALKELKGWSTAKAQLVETTTDYKQRQRLWTGNGTWLALNLTFCCTLQSQVPLSTKSYSIRRRTDGRYQTYYLPCLVVDKNWSSDFLSVRTVLFWMGSGLKLCLFAIKGPSHDQPETKNSLSKVWVYYIVGTIQTIVGVTAWSRDITLLLV